MRKIFASILLAVMPAIALAQTPAPAQPNCWPAPFGTGTYYNAGSIDAGDYYFWWCRNAAGQYTMEYVYRTNNYKLKHPDPTGKNQRQLLADYYGSNVNREDGVANATFMAAVHADPRYISKRPKDDVMVVAPNGTYDTRPTFLLHADGFKRADTRKDGDTGVGLYCWCHVPLYRSIEGNNVYCPYVFYENVPLPPPAQVEVTLCRAQKTSE